MLAYGLSYLALWWDEDGRKPTVLMEPRMRNTALRCDSCGTIVIPSPPPPPPPAIFKRMTNELARTVYRTIPRRKR